MVSKPNDRFQVGAITAGMADMGLHSGLHSCAVSEPAARYASPIAVHICAAIKNP